MSIRISCTEIDSFCGNVLPLTAVREGKAGGRIVWRVLGDAVQLRAFDREEEFPFDCGVLLTMMKPGEAEVQAEADGELARCALRVRERKKADPDGPMNYYIGDFHDHTTSEHNHARFAARTGGFPIDCISCIRDEGRLDFSVISDHAVTTNPRDFFRGFTDEQAAQPMELIVFPGAESEVTVVETDRYGYKHKNSGEIVTVNASDFSHSETWEGFFEKMAGSPFAVCSLAHPQIIGYSVPGIWNFSLDKNNTPELKRLIRLVEMGNGSGWKSNLLNEYVYSVALDNGFHVSPACSSDSHGPEWGFDVFPGKTVIMAPEKSREAFLDALLNNRVYACESGNVKLRVEVNGHAAPCMLTPAARYDFLVKTGYFGDDPASHPVRCQVISDRGIALKEITGDDLSEMEFSVEADGASYFYLRLTDGMGRKTWSPPVWTGRKAEKPPENALYPLEKADMTAFDLADGREAGEIICDDPERVWTAEGAEASVLIDLMRERRVAAVSHYPVPLTYAKLKKENASAPEKMAGFLSRYRISVSRDGERFTPCAEGIIRTFGGEEIVRFDPQTARYVRVEMLSTVGRESGLPEYRDAKVSVGELTVFTDEKGKE
ncbi:MAG: discoidin domain-containing protein [Clostridia bacterium]|nr:discoidin domain-containing protein [Clostridia bacterium]